MTGESYPSPCGFSGLFLTGRLRAIRGEEGEKTSDQLCLESHFHADHRVRI